MDSRPKEATTAGNTRPILSASLRPCISVLSDELHKTLFRYYVSDTQTGAILNQQLIEGRICLMIGALRISSGRPAAFVHASIRSRKNQPRLNVLFIYSRDRRGD